MNDLTLYEQIPKSSFPIRLLDFHNEPYTFPIHWHEHIEIHYIFSGTATIRCAYTFIELSPNDCVIVNGNELHQGIDGICDYGCMILPPSFFYDSHIIFDRAFKDENLYLSRMQKLDKINNAVQYINDHFSEKITTVQLAELTHLSEGHFCNTFKEATGLTAKEYINEVRIKNAADLIKSTDMTIAEAAMYSGFPDANYFTKMFKKLIGTTPTSLRKD